MDLLVEGFELVAFDPSDHASAVNTLAVYIEGDGRAYSYRGPRSDPTPFNPLALELALKDPWPKKTYLARPCQYQRAAALKRCDPVYWTTGRYASEAVGAMNGALDRLKKRHNVNRLALIGYSGGGVMAMLLAARREDVDSVLTIASPLDLDLWADHHKVTRLFHSLKPMDEALNTQLVCQVHLVGQQDDVVPLRTVQGFVFKLNSERARLNVVEQVDHSHGWLDLWPAVLKQYRETGSVSVCP